MPSEDVPINIGTLVSQPKADIDFVMVGRPANLCIPQLLKGLSVHSWPTGHAVDMEETIQFSELQDVDCMIEKFPLEKANEAYG